MLGAPAAISFWRRVARWWSITRRCNSIQPRDGPTRPCVNLPVHPPPTMRWRDQVAGQPAKHIISGARPCLPARGCAMPRTHEGLPPSGHQLRGVIALAQPRRAARRRLHRAVGRMSERPQNPALCGGDYKAGAVRARAAYNRRARAAELELGNCGGGYTWATNRQRAPFGGGGTGTHWCHQASQPRDRDRRLGGELNTLPCAQRTHHVGAAITPLQ
jgi:hypothetical protein